MPHSPFDAREVIARECEFPAEHEAVVAALEGEDIATPDGTTVDLGSVLELSGESRYRSVADLHSTVLANLGEEHVGRKYYDDRSPNPVRDENLSF